MFLITKKYIYSFLTCFLLSLLFFQSSHRYCFHISLSVIRSSQTFQGRQMPTKVKSPGSSICHVLHDVSGCCYGDPPYLYVQTSLQAPGYGAQESGDANHECGQSTETASHTKQRICFREWRERFQLTRRMKSFGE